MISRTEIVSSLEGCFRLARGKDDALSYFNISSDGFWRSFIAMALSLLVSVLQSYLEVFAYNRADLPEVEGLKSGALEFSLYPMLIILLSWLTFLIFVYAISRSAGFHEKYWTFAIVYNWCQLAIIGVWFVLSVFILGTVGIEQFALFFFLYLIASYMFLWFVAVRTLAVTTLMATGLIFVEFLITVTYLVLT